MKFVEIYSEELEDWSGNKNAEYKLEALTEYPITCP